MKIVDWIATGVTALAMTPFFAEVSKVTQPQIPFYDRRGVLVTPQAHSVVKPRQGAWVLAKADDAVMMLWPGFAGGVPDLPGGGVDAGEDLVQASAREWYEETGLDFTPKAGPLATYHQLRGFYAEDRDEFWVYDQTFFLYRFERKQEIGARWRNPEGDLAGWVGLNDLPTSQLNRAHWLGVCALMPEIGE